MSYVALNTIDVPTTGTTIPTNWGVAVNNNFAAHQTAITTNASNIATNTSNISTLTTNLATAQTSITNLIAGVTTFNGNPNFANSIEVGYNLTVGNYLSVGTGGINTSGSVSASGNISGAAIYASSGNFLGDGAYFVAATNASSGAQQQMTLRIVGGNTEVRFPYNNAGLPTGAGTEVIFNTNSSSLQLMVLSSKAELKDNIRFLSESGLDNKTNPIFKLRPRLFKWKDEEIGDEEVGFIAEEIYEDSPMLSITTDGKPSFYKQRSILALAVEAIQSLSKRVDTLEMQLNQSMQSINTLNALPALYTLGTKVEDEADER